MRGGAKKGGQGEKRVRRKPHSRVLRSGAGGQEAGAAVGEGSEGEKAPPAPPQILTCGSLCSGAK